MVSTRRQAQKASSQTGTAKPSQVAKPSITKSKRATKKESSVDVGPRYFLMKAEPETRIEKGIDVRFSIDDLAQVESEPWDGVRNAEASKTMRERMKVGDLAFFYHSNTKLPGIAGIAVIDKEGYPDSSAWNADHPYYDPKTDESKPKWYRVDVKYVRHMARFVSLRELKDANLPALQSMQLLRRPQLSVQRVSPEEWQCIMDLEKQAAPGEDDASDAKTPAQKRPRDTTRSAEDERQQREEQDKQVKEEIRITHGG